MSEPIKSLLDTSASERTNMSEVESKIYITMLMSEHSANPQCRETLSEEGYAELVKMDYEKVKSHLMETILFGGQLMHRRFFVFCNGVIPVTNIVALFVVLMSRGNPGRMVLWCYTLWRAYQESGEIINMEALTKLFPWGFPTEETYAHYWDLQKNPEKDNRIDEVSEWL